MGVKKMGMDDRQAAATSADAIEALFKGLGLPVRLSEVGVPDEGVDLIAADAMTDFGLHRNVRKIQGVDDLKKILESVR
jgi:alcohol dehydrogenase class IV